MIKIVAQFFVKEDSIENAIWLSRDVAEKSKKENGCINYEVFQDDKKSGHLIMIEEWKSEEDLNMNVQSLHYINYISRITEIMENGKSFIVESYHKLH